MKQGNWGLIEHWAPNFLIWNAPNIPQVCALENIPRVLTPRSFSVQPHLFLCGAISPIAEIAFNDAQCSLSISLTHLLDWHTKTFPHLPVSLLEQFRSWECAKWRDLKKGFGTCDTIRESEKGKKGTLLVWHVWVPCGKWLVYARFWYFVGCFRSARWRHIPCLVISLSINPQLKDSTSFVSFSCPHFLRCSRPPIHQVYYHFFMGDTTSAFTQFDKFLHHPQI